MKLAELIEAAADTATSKGHVLGKFKTHKLGAVGKCRVCSNHVRVESATAEGTIFGKAVSESCGGAS